MHVFKPLAAFSSLLFGSMTNHLKLNVTAVSARDGQSTIECWQLQDPFAWSPSGAFVAQFSGLSNMTYTFVPPNFDTGATNAPSKQWVIVISGLLHVSLPHDNSTSAYFPASQHDIIFAEDTADISQTGHISQFLGTTEGVFLQIPTNNGQTPVHRNLHMGPCKTYETSGLKELAVGSSLRTYS